MDLSVISRQDSRTGIQRVVRSIWDQLGKVVGADIQVVPVSGNGGAGYYVLPNDFWRSNGDRQDDLESISPAPGDIFLGLDLSVRLLPQYEKQFEHWRRNGLLIYLLVYDLLPLANRRWFRWRTRRNFRGWLRVLARQAHGAICISKEVSRELSRWLEGNARSGMNVIKVHDIRLGPNFQESLPSTGLPSYAELIFSRMREVPTLLMVGTVEPRKGYGVALDAFSYIWSDRKESPVDLIVAGRPGWKTRRLQSRMRRLEHANPAFRWLDDVSDEFLCQLYRESVGLLVCSYAEGYGLPLIEAVHMDVPVLARDIRVFREIAGDKVRYFVKDDRISLSNTIVEFLHSVQSGQYISGEGGALSHSWSEATTELLSHIERDTGLKICL